MAWNCLAEHRISPDRFRSFSGYLASDPLTPELLQEAFGLYQKSEVRPSVRMGSKPAYELDTNRNNLVPLAADTPLCTVLDLTRIGYVYAQAKDWNVPEFKRFDLSHASAVNEFLGDRLNDPGMREPFLDAVLKAINRYRREAANQIHPTWAATWDSVQRYLKPANPRRWIESVGVTKEASVWVAVLRYPAPSEVFRPTLLDAGWYAHHFPSPPDAALGTGGITMDLSKTPPTESGLVSEYIHRQVDFSIEHWKAAGCLVDLTDGPVPDPKQALSELRRRHLERLIEPPPGYARWVAFDL